MKSILFTLPFLALLSSSRPPSGGTPTAPRSDEVGVIKGRAAFQGEAPRRRKVDMGSDPACHKLHEAEPLKDESIIVDEKGGLANVFVYVSKGLEGKKFTPPAEPAVLDQKGCCYAPHVLGVQVGQKLMIKNSDPVTHNVHSFAKKNKAFNQSQQSGGKDLELVFDKEEVLMQVKCDIHGWMSTYLGVVEHPFFAVTSADGSFELKGLPPGEYTLSAKHEALGSQKTTLTVGAGGTVEASFSFTEE
jgi:plastocyanin